MLKSRIRGRIKFTDQERRTLVDTALAMSRKLMESVVNIVKPATILAWQRRLEKQKWDYSQRRNRKPGRPRTAANIEVLICEMARDNTWGYKRIQGELEKLGITISKTSVATILRKNGLPPSPEPTGLTWREFLSRHAEVFLCADLFTKEVGHDMGESEKVSDRYARVGAIQCQQFLGGLLKSYSRKVA